MSITVMNRMTASLGSVVFLFIAPGTIAGLIPWWMTRWHVKPSLLDGVAPKIVGIVLIVLGLAALLDSFARFALVGLGTPAPALPTRHLVVSGLYRYVRNPIYLAVTALILGQALLFAHPGLFFYGVLVWLCFHLFVIGHEEPTLRKTFGPEYENYCLAVARWLPRMRPWTAPV